MAAAPLIIAASVAGDPGRDGERGAGGPRSASPVPAVSSGAAAATSSSSRIAGVKVDRTQVSARPGLACYSSKQLQANTATHFMNDIVPAFGGTLQWGGRL